MQELVTFEKTWPIIAHSVMRAMRVVRLASSMFKELASAWTRRFALRRLPLRVTLIVAVCAESISTRESVLKRPPLRMFTEVLNVAASSWMFVTFCTVIVSAEEKRKKEEKKEGSREVQAQNRETNMGAVPKKHPFANTFLLLPLFDIFCCYLPRDDRRCLI
jgi:hypothetical protein